MTLAKSETTVVSCHCHVTLTHCDTIAISSSCIAVDNLRLIFSDAILQGTV